MPQNEPELPGFLNNDYVNNVLQQVEGTARAVLEGVENIGNVTLDVITGLLDRGLGLVGLGGSGGGRSEGVALDRGSTGFGDPHHQLTPSLSPRITPPQIDSPAIAQSKGVSAVQQIESPDIKSALQEMKQNQSLTFAMDCNVSPADLGTGLTPQAHLPNLGIGKGEGMNV